MVDDVVTFEFFSFFFEVLDVVTVGVLDTFVVLDVVAVDGPLVVAVGVHVVAVGILLLFSFWHSFDNVGRLDMKQNTTLKSQEKPKNELK